MPNMARKSTVRLRGRSFKRGLGGEVTGGDGGGEIRVW